MVSLLFPLLLAPVRADDGADLPRVVGLEREMAQEDRVYRAGIHMHHASYAVAAGSFGLMTVGTLLKIRTCAMFNSGPCSPTGIALNRVGMVGYVGGSVLSRAGTLVEGRALRARGRGGPETWAYAGLGMAVGSAGVAGLLFGLAESKSDDGFGAVQGQQQPVRLGDRHRSGRRAGSRPGPAPGACPTAARRGRGRPDADALARWARTVPRRPLLERE
ncbi:MAG: hypothetical protein EP330_14055 [Deltaproteobacteria bacterium]|nr:MAG: hypothetical protein EP330_14055 [Deltaproteobacteria bacterium]